MTYNVIELYFNKFCLKRSFEVELIYNVKNILKRLSTLYNSVLLYISETKY